MTMFNVCYIVNDHCDEWFKMSVKQAGLIADRFVFVIDRPDQFTWDVIEQAQGLKQTVILHARYLKESKTADGTFRTVYLDWLKSNADGEWALVLDTDEVLSDYCYHLISRTRQNEIGCFDIKMRHVWWSLGLEDASVKKHMVPRRLFKVKAGLCYPFVEHPKLEGWEQVGEVEDVQIWHMNVVKGLLSEIAKYKTQCVKSNIHSPEMLLAWHNLHVMGNVPVIRFNLAELPKVVRDFACINDDGSSKLYQVNK